MIDRAKLRARYDVFSVSIITNIEVYAYDFPVETQKNILNEIFDSLEIIEIGKEIAERTILYRKIFSPTY